MANKESRRDRIYQAIAAFIIVFIISISFFLGLKIYSKHQAKESLNTNSIQIAKIISQQFEKEDIKNIESLINEYQVLNIFIFKKGSIDEFGISSGEEIKIHGKVNENDREIIHNEIKKLTGRLTDEIIKFKDEKNISESLLSTTFEGSISFLISAFPLKRNNKLEGFIGVIRSPVYDTYFEFDLKYLLIILLVNAIILLFFTKKFALFIKEIYDKPLIYLSITPTIIGVLLLTFLPFIMGVGLAFFNNNYEFIGIDNFKEILFPSATADTNFYFTFGVTIMWTVLNVSLHVLIGLFLALLLSDANIRGKGIYRVLLIVPWSVPNYITALIWKWMFNTQYGPINAIIGIFGIEKIDWLGTSFWTNFAANLITNTWLGFPFMMVVSLGALQSIPKELYEAAHIDGATRWQKFKNITLPLLKPALFPAIILGTIWTFNMFNVVYLVSGGAPDNETNILITEAYRAFRVLKRYGFAAAYSLIIFAILFVYTIVTNKITKATEGAFD